MAAFERLGPNAADSEHSKRPAGPTASQAAAIVQRVLRSKGALPSGAILQLQSAIGNHAVCKIGPGNADNRFVDATSGPGPCVQRETWIVKDPATWAAEESDRKNLRIDSPKTKLTELTQAGCKETHKTSEHSLRGWCLSAEEWWEGRDGIRSLRLWVKHADPSKGAGTSTFGTDFTAVKVNKSGNEVPGCFRKVGYIPHYHALEYCVGDTDEVGQLGKNTVDRSIVDSHSNLPTQGTELGDGAHIFAKADIAALKQDVGNRPSDDIEKEVFQDKIYDCAPGGWAQS